MTPEQIKVLEAVRDKKRKYLELMECITADSVQPDHVVAGMMREKLEIDALTAALSYIEDMREIEAAAERLREAFKSVKGGKD